MQRLLPLAAIVGFALGACRGDFQADCEPGNEGCACSDQGDCFGELLCLSNLCVTPDEAETGAETATMSGDGDSGDGDSGDGDGDSGDGDSGDGDSGDGDSGDGDGSTGDGDATTTTTSTTGNPEDIPVDDEFDLGELDDIWQVYNSDRAEMSFADSRIILDPDPFSVWWEGSQAILVFQMGSGDFMVTADITATNLAETGPPTTGLRLGGVMMRDPYSSTENYVAALVGAGADALVIETKTTTESQSDLQEYDWPAAAAELRICRVGSTFRLLARNQGQSAWTQLIDYERPDLPTDMDAGIVAYAAEANADLRVTSDWIHFAAVTSLGDCEG